MLGQERRNSDHKGNLRNSNYHGNVFHIDSINDNILFAILQLYKMLPLGEIKWRARGISLYYFLYFRIIQHNFKIWQRKISESLEHLNKFHNWKTLNIFFNHFGFNEAHTVIFFYLLRSKEDNEAMQSTSL